MSLFKWKYYSPEFVSKRYNKLAVIYPVFELIFGLPRGIRKKAVNALNLETGFTVIEIGCGTGKNLELLSNAVGQTGKVYGIDVSQSMLAKADEQKKKKNLNNVELINADAGSYSFPDKINGVLFSLSYAVMAHRKEVLVKLWEKLIPGGKIVIMDAQYPPGLLGKLMTPFKPALFLFLKATVIGNMDIKIADELKEITGNVNVQEFSFKTYFIATAIKSITP
jgi:ubiquinone/menaquinone biosynthesis C-methylase UbiE